MDKVICIVGPTGIGKTSLSLALAQAFNTEIINGDAIQVFKDVNILSAKVSLEQQDKVKHYLIDICNVEANYDVATFKRDASLLIKQLNQKGLIPIIVGGSGFYLKALLYDYNFEEVPTRSTNISEKYATYDNELLFKHLQCIDLEASLILHPNNRKRVLRAIEIFETTKQSKSDHLKLQKHELIYDALIIGLNKERSALYDLINKRVDIMVEDGLVQEVKSLIDLYGYQSYQVFNAIGFKELIPYFKEGKELDECLALIKQNSRRYAKKQITWFNNQMNVTWISSEDDFKISIDKAIKIVKESFYE